MKELFSASDAKPSNLLRDQYGEEVVLFNDQEESNIYRILREFSLYNQIYAVMQSGDCSSDEEYEIFRVNSSEGSMELETIDDEEEWENIAEVYDEMVFNDENL